MKRYAVLILLIFSLNIANAQTSISGRIVAAPTDRVYLMQHNGFSTKKISTAILNLQGDFHFTIPLEIPIVKGFYRIQFNDSVFADLVLSPEEKIVIKSDAFWLQDSLKIENSPENHAFFEMRRIQLKYISDVKKFQENYMQISANDSLAFIKRNKIEQDFEKYQRMHNTVLDTFALKFNNTFIGRLAKIQKIPLLSDYPEERAKYSGNTEFMLDHFFDYIDFSMPELVRGSDVFDKFVIYLEQYAPKTVEGFKMGIDFILKKTMNNPELYKESVKYLAENFEIRGPEEIFLYIVDTYSESCNADEDFADVIKGRDKLLALGIGKVAPEMELPDSSGKMIKLSEVIKEKKAVLLLFWASWCDHCQQLVPQISGLYNAYKDKGLEVMAVSLDSNEKEWSDFIKKNHLTWINLCDFKKWKSPIVNEYFVKKTPQFYLINNQGIIVGKNMSLHKLQGGFEHLLGH